MRGRWLFLMLLLGWVPGVWAATLYVSNVACTNTYQVGTNTCGGASGVTSYTSITTADSASAAGDTINLRSVSPAGSYSITTAVVPKANTTWQTYPTDLPTRATITSSGLYVINLVASGATIKELILTGSQRSAIWPVLGGLSNIVIDGVEVFGWNSVGNIDIINYHPGIYLGGNTTPGDDCHGGDLAGANKNFILRNSYIHDPVGTGGPSDPFTVGAISAGCSDSGHLIENNIVEDTPHGIWIDVDGGNPALGLTPHIVRNNVALNIRPRYCYHLEARSSWTLQNNLCNGSVAGIFVRVGGTSDTMTNLVMQNNTVAGVDNSAFVVIYEGGGATLINSNIDNNIFSSTSNAYALLLVDPNTAASASNTWRNNLFYSPNSALGVCWGTTTVSWYDCTGGTLYNDDTTGINAWNSAVGPAATNISGNPLFVNPATNDFDLQAGSPAINAGLNVGLPFNGAFPDIGAFESGVTAPGGSFPQVAGTPALSSDNTTGSASHTVTLPTGITAGETLIVLMSMKGLPALTFPAGWTIFSTISASDRRLVSAWRKATGTEGASMTVTATVPAGAGRGAFYTARISGATDPTVTPPQMSTGTTGATGAPTPDLLAPTGGSKNYLWLAIAGFGDSGAGCPADVTAYPASYTDGVQQNSGGGNAAEGRIGVARRELAAASEQPGAFTMSCTTVTQMAATLAIHPAPTGPTCTTTSPTSGAPAGVPVSTEICITLVSGSIEHHGCATGATAPDRANCVGWDFDPAQADMWMMSWASDGNVYGLWGDGRGWNGTVADGAIGATAITDDPPTMAATDVYTQGSRSPNYKARSFVADSSSVMRGFYELESDSWDHAFALSSANNGTSWTFTGTQVFSKTTHGVAVIAMAQSGQGYTGTLPAGVSDTYYYVYLGCWTGAGGCADSTHLYLARVPKASWNTLASYEYFTGLDGSNNPVWSSTIGSKAAIFTDTNGVTAGGQTGVFYNPYWQRWMLSTPHTTAGCTTNEPCRLGIFESPSPWGPWQTLYYGDFLDTFWKFSYQTPQKWMAADGLSFWMSYSGWPEYDNVNVVRFDVTLAATDTVAPGAPTNLRIAQP